MAGWDIPKQNGGSDGKIIYKWVIFHGPVVKLVPSTQFLGVGWLYLAFLMNRSINLGMIYGSSFILGWEPATSFIWVLVRMVPNRWYGQCLSPMKKCSPVGIIIPCQLLELPWLEAKNRAWPEQGLSKNRPPPLPIAILSDTIVIPKFVDKKKICTMHWWNPWFGQVKMHKQPFFGGWSVSFIGPLDSHSSQVG